MQFSFYVIPPGQGYPGQPPDVWTGPGPMPTTLQESFWVDPASATGSYVTYPGEQGGLVLSRVDEAFTASNVTLTANGQIVQQSASGSFTIWGDRANLFGPGGSFFGYVTLPGGQGGSDFGSDYAQAPPDWAAFLMTSDFRSDTGPFTLSGSFGELSVFMQDGHPVPVSVPEPGVLALCVLAAAGLVAMHRRPRRAIGIARCGAQLAGSKRARN